MSEQDSVDAASIHPIVHTPGPWEAVRSLMCGHLRAAHNYQVDPREEWTDADLKLISAAPYLLDALEESLALNINWSETAEEDHLRHLSEYKRVIQQARAAIEKAFYDSQHPQEQGMWNLACIGLFACFWELT